MPDTTHYGCKCDLCGVQPIEGTIYVDRDPIQNFGVCERCYNGSTPEEKASLHGPISTFTDSIRFHFKSIDTDGDGVISRDELNTFDTCCYSPHDQGPTVARVPMNTFVAGRGLSEGAQGQFFNEIDLAQDGVISFSEFWNFFRGICHAPEAPAPDLEEEEAAAQAQAREAAAVAAQIASY